MVRGLTNIYIYICEGQDASSKSVTKLQTCYTRRPHTLMPTRPHSTGLKALSSKLHPRNGPRTYAKPTRMPALSVRGVPDSKPEIFPTTWRHVVGTMRQSPTPYAYAGLRPPTKWLRGRSVKPSACIAQVTKEKRCSSLDYECVIGRTSSSFSTAPER